MTIVKEINHDFNQILKYGEQIRLKYYNQSYTGEYDDDVTLTQSGIDVWCSGLVQPIDSRMGAFDAMLLQQGKVTIDDKKIYIPGSVQTSGLGPIKIGMTGSPVTKEYQILEDGYNIEWSVNGSMIYKKLYVRHLNNGSFIGE